MLKLVPPMARRVIICKMKMQKAIAFAGRNQKMMKRIARITTAMMLLIFFVFINEFVCLPSLHGGGGGGFGSGTAAAY